jgi:hypothetical protein
MFFFVSPRVEHRRIALEGQVRDPHVFVEQIAHDVPRVDLTEHRDYSNACGQTNHRREAKGQFPAQTAALDLPWYDGVPERVGNVSHQSR